MGCSLLIAEPVKNWGLAAVQSTSCLSTAAVDDMAAVDSFTVASMAVSSDSDLQLEQCPKPLSCGCTWEELSIDAAHTETPSGYRQYNCPVAAIHPKSSCNLRFRAFVACRWLAPGCPLMSVQCCAVPCHAVLQVKVAEHVLTRHKVAIKILNRRKIQAMDMEEKGGDNSTAFAKPQQQIGLL